MSEVNKADDRPGAAAWVPVVADSGVSNRGIATESGAATAVDAAAVGASGAEAIEALKAAATGCQGCELWRDATHVVFSAGPARAPLMLVGEQPGDREDLEGRPFVGPAGRLLADAVTAAGIGRGTLYVTNAVKHFRHEMRGARRLHKTPGVAHVVACHPWLEAEIGVVAPRVILCLGATAARAVLGRTASVTKERGRLLDAPGLAGRGAGDVKVLVTNHPSAVLRMRGEEGFDGAMAALVADLKLAASYLA